MARQQDGKFKIETAQEMGLWGIDLEEPKYNTEFEWPQKKSFSEHAKSKGWYNGNAKVFAMKMNYVFLLEGTDFKELPFSSD